MTHPIALDAMQKMLKQEIEHRLDAIVYEELKEVTKRIETEIKKELGNIAVSLLKQYDLDYSGGSLIIKVRNELK